MNVSLGSNRTTFSQMNDTTQVSPLFIAIQLTCFPVIIAAGLIGNTLICVAVWKRSKLRTIDYFILNLAVTDLGTCIISIPFDFVDILTARWQFGSVLCKMVYPLQTILVAVSVYTLLCMSLERYRAVIRPFKPKIKGKRALAIVVCGWVSALCLVSPYITSLDVHDGTCSETWDEMYSRIFTLLVFIIEYLLPLFVITGAYVKISQKLWRDIQRIRRATGARERNKKPLIKARARRNMRIVKIFVFAVITFALCMLPTHVMWMWSGYGNGAGYEYFNNTLVFCNILMYSNSAINPFIFVFLHTRYCRDLWHCCPFPLLVKECRPPKRKRSSRTLFSSRMRSTKRLPYSMQLRLPQDFEMVDLNGDLPWRIERKRYSPQNILTSAKEQRQNFKNSCLNHTPNQETGRTILPRRQKVNFGEARIIRLNDKRADVASEPV